MKKLLVILVVILILIYLNRTYAYFYNFIGQKDLLPPAHATTLIIGDQPTRKIIKYLALGDSLTAGVGVSDYKKSYPYLVAQKLSQKNNVELTNLAHTGDTSTEVAANQLPKTASLKPDLITVLIGVNDLHNLRSLREFENNYDRIVSTLKKSGARIYLLSIPYLGSDNTVIFPYNFILDFRTKQFNNMIKKVAAGYGVQYIDIYSLSKPADFYSPDQFHPAEAGYSLWATHIKQNLNL